MDLWQRGNEERAKSVSRHMPALVPLSSIAISSQRALGEEHEVYNLLLYGEVR